MVDWDQDTSLEFIEEYQKASILWDSKNPYYYSKSKKQEVWEEIAAKFDVDVEDLKKKMNSLLGSFRRERSKTRKGIITEKGRREYVSKWFAFNSLKFLLERNENDCSDSGYTENIEEIENSSENSSSCAPVSTNMTTPKVCFNKRIKTEDSNQVVNFSYDSKMLDTNIVNEKDEFDAIGCNVAAKLRSMRTTQRIVAEKLIHDSLYYGQLEKLCDSSCILLHQQ